MIRGRGGRVKAVILAGGEGTRLRPLTLKLPKPTAPVLDRPLLAHQIDLLAQAGIHEIIFSLGYQPDRIREVFGDGAAWGAKIHYVVEATPLGTGGAVKNAQSLLDDTTIVFNGDVLIDVDLAAVIAEHKKRAASATIVLTPVENPSAYGLVETDPAGRVLRFTEKPKDADQIRTNNINAGIYLLDTATLGLMPEATKYSIERSFFPALLERGDLVRGHVHRGYWIDIGTPEKYLQVHKDILNGAFLVKPQALAHPSGGWIDARARVDPGAILQGPFYVGPGCEIASGATIGAGAVLTSQIVVESAARISDAVIWPRSVIEEGSEVKGALLAARVRVGKHAFAGPGSVLGEGTVLSDHSRTLAPM
jgi:NDP-sugar pyrophosphorylase family protein